MLRNHRQLSTRRLDLITANLSTRSPTFATSATVLQLQQRQALQQRYYGTTLETTGTRNSASASTTAAAATATATAGSQETTTTTCPTTIARPPLSPLPYLYLRDLPYGRSTELQERLVERQIRLRKQREDQRAKRTMDHDNSSPVDTLPVPKEDGSHDLILLVEHSPTYTNGRRNRGERSIGEQETARLERLGAIYVESLRGGEITFHGPGQLVAYPIMDLKPARVFVSGSLF